VLILDEATEGLAPLIVRETGGSSARSARLASRR
jgi:ABC-type branched-subunit amino acid transport system ATPase component